VRPRKTKVRAPRRSSTTRPVRRIVSLAEATAHDVRNTLGGVVLRLRLLQGAVPAQREQLVLVERVLNDALASLGRLQDTAGGRRTRTARSADLHQVLEDAVAVALVPVELRLPPRLPRVRGAPAALKHVFLNLLLNARDTAGRARISARRERRGVTVVVSDDGPGIPPADLPRIFELHFTSKGTRGGLGLPIALAELQRIGGTITASNQPTGGAVFTLWLPPA
jgi:signal transduction histidine kinase